MEMTGYLLYTCCGHSENQRSNSLACGGSIQRGEEEAEWRGKKIGPMKGCVVLPMTPLASWGWRIDSTTFNAVVGEQRMV